MLLQWLSMAGGTRGLGGPMSLAGPLRTLVATLPSHHPLWHCQALSSSWRQP